MGARRIALTMHGVGGNPFGILVSAGAGSQGPERECHMTVTVG